MDDESLVMLRPGQYRLPNAPMFVLMQYEDSVSIVFASLVFVEHGFQCSTYAQQPLLYDLFSGAVTFRNSHGDCLLLVQYAGSMMP